MPHRAEMFTGGKLRSYVVSIGATEVTVRSLIEASLQTDGISINDVIQVIFPGKIAAGTDRAAMLTGHSAAEMNCYYGAGVDCDPPTRGVDWYVVRSAGDVTATALILLDQ